MRGEGARSRLYRRLKGKRGADPPRSKRPGHTAMRVVTATGDCVQAPAAPDAADTAVAVPVVLSLSKRRGTSRDGERMLAGLAFLEAVVAAERAHRDVTGGARR
jgi:hypothetical protein